MITRLAALGLTLFLAVSCTPLGVLTTVGSTAGTFALEERGIEGATRDLGLKADVVAKWANENLSYAADLSVIVYNSKAMITGIVDNEQERAKAIDLTWQVEGITDVYNDIVLKKDTSIEDYAHDTLIDAKLFAALTFDAQVMDINYKFNTEGATVYVIGLAQSPAELKRFIAHAKSISHVRRVVSHVEIKPRKSMFRTNNDTKSNSPS